LRQSARDKDILLQEINHRIKNLFGLTSGLISLSARSNDNIDDLVADLRSRMQALARAHELTLPVPGTNEANERLTSIVALIEAIVAPHNSEQQSAVEIIGSDVPLSGKALTSLALLLHELTTNSAKYGALSSPESHLAIEIVLDEELLHLHWREIGVKMLSKQPERQGFGATLEKATLQGLNGMISREWRPDGLYLVLKIPSAQFNTA